MLQKFISISCLMIIACSASDENLVPPQTLGTPSDHRDLITGIGMTHVALKTHSDAAARDLINSLGQQQTSAMLGWQVEPDYWPMQHCFDHWYGTGEISPSAEQIADCEVHVKDLSRLYASYGVDAWPVIFKSNYYWDEQDKFGLAFPHLVEDWKAAGGTKDDESFLKHPNCAEPLQEGWTGSDFFYDGQEHPTCQSLKIEALEKAALERKVLEKD